MQLQGLALDLALWQWMLLETQCFREINLSMPLTVHFQRHEREEMSLTLEFAY